jgi:hypothetical protein
MLEQRLFATGAPLEGMKERRSLIDAILGHTHGYGRLMRSWKFVEAELTRIANIRAGCKTPKTPQGWPENSPSNVHLPPPGF